MEDRLEIWLELIGGKLDRLIELGENVERASRLHEMLEDSGERQADHFAGANKMVADEPAKDKPAAEPPKKWRRLTDEFVQPGDWANAKVNRQDVDPPDEGWIPADPCYFGKRACTLSMYFARPVAEEPAKEPEHPAGPMPDPGEGYRLLSKDPPEELQPGDDFFGDWDGGWHQCIDVLQGICEQKEDRWYRRKIDPAKEAEHPAEPMPSIQSYRPVDDGDIGKIVEVQNSTADPWRECTLLAIDWDRPYGFLCGHVGFYRPMQWRFARIKIDEPAKEPEPEHPAGPMPDPGEGYRILSKNPPEDLNPNAEWYDVNEDRWCGIFPTNTTAQHPRVWYRLKTEVAKEPVDHLAVPRISPGDWVYIHEAYRDVTPADVGKLVIVRNDAKTPWIELRLAEVTGADFPYRCTKDGLDPTMWQAFRYACIRNEKPKEPQAAWWPRVGDWVRVTRPENWEKCWSPCWLAEMHQFDGKVGCIERCQGSCRRIRGFVGSDGLQYQFHRDWLSPAEPPAKEEPPKDEYREPVLPADAGKKCQFSDDGETWLSGWVDGWMPARNWVTLNNNSWKHARIKKDA